jgi:predicted GNAT family acetyltransferase
MKYTIAPVHVKRPTDPAEFLAAAGDLLLADEARHNLVLGLAGTLRDQPAMYPEFRLWLVADEDRVVASALQTPPFNLVVAGDADGVAHLAEALAADGVELPGVTGATPEVDAFAARWEALAGRRAVARMRQRIYRLVQLRRVTGVPGESRVATAADRDLVLAWVQAFADEAGSQPTHAERVVDARFGEGDASGFLLWEDDSKPVSLAGWVGPTPNGIRVGPVYTPPERRRRGFGSAVTAAVSERQLAGGRRFCFLYTDLANPTSNRIYMDIGYEPVCDSVDYDFATT